MDFSSPTIIIILINCIVSYMALNDSKLMSNLLLTPYSIKKNKEYYRFITSGFIHADFQHLIFNMISLYFFGYIAEAWLGTGLYILFYLAAIVVSDIPTYLKNKNNSYYASLGASGAVSAVIFASIILHPLGELSFVFLPFLKIPAIVFGIAYLVYSYYMDKQSRDNVNHSAHLFGALFGLAFIGVLYPTTIPAMIESITGALQNLLP